MAAPQKQLRNLMLHAQVVGNLHKMSPTVRKHILKNASPKLVEALATAARIVDKKGYKFDPFHQRRAKRLMSTRVAKRNKQILVRGKPGTHSRGEKFFADLSQAFAKEVPGLMAGPGMLDDVQNADTINAAVLPYVTGGGFNLGSKLKKAGKAVGAAAATAALLYGANRASKFDDPIEMSPLSYSREYDYAPSSQMNPDDYEPYRQF